MSYDFIDGCDYKSTDNTYLNQKWRAISTYSALNFNLQNGFSAHSASVGGCIKINRQGNSWKGIVLTPPARRAASSDYYLHYWFDVASAPEDDTEPRILVLTNAPSLPSNKGSWGGFSSGSTAYTVVELALLSSGYLRLSLNGTVLATATQTNLLTVGNWQCLRIKVNIDGSAGAFQVYVGTNTTPEIDYTGALYTGGGEGIDYIAFATSYAAAGTAYYIDDIIAYEPGGNAPSGHFSGPRLISTSVTTSDAAPNDGAPSTGSSHYPLLDELPPSASDYVNLPATAGDAEMFGFGSGAVVPAGATNIEAVVVSVWGSASGAASHSVKGRCDSSATTGYGDTKDVNPGSISVVQSAINVDPNTSAAWTESGVNAAKFGVELVA